MSLLGQLRLISVRTSLALALAVGPGIQYAEAQQIKNPFIPDEVVGQMDDDPNKLFTDARDAQASLNATIACALWSVYYWIAKPILIVWLVGSFFYNLLQMIRGTGSDSVSALLWSLAGMAFFLMPVNRSAEMYKNTIIESLVVASGFTGSQVCAATKGLIQYNGGSTP